MILRNKIDKILHKLATKDLNVIAEGRNEALDAILKEVEKVLPKEIIYVGMTDAWYEGFNACRDEMLKLLKEGKA